MGLGTRLAVGIPAAIVGGFFGPGVAYIFWKGAGFATTGNPLYLIPGGGTLSDAFGAISDFADVASTGVDVASTGVSDLAVDHMGMHADLADGAGPDIHGNPSDLNTYGNRPLDVQGHELGRTITGDHPTDAWGRPQ